MAHLVLNGESIGKPCRVCGLRIGDEECYWSFIDHKGDLTLRVHTRCEPLYIGIIDRVERVQSGGR